MGNSQAAKSDNHQRIVALAARRFRELGIDGLSVADLMKEAGLTHGGFYRHFDSRDDLVAEAVECALKQGSERVAKLPTPARKASLNALIDAYLSTVHRDVPGDGCAVPALASDMTRSDERSRNAYTQQVRNYLEIIGGMLNKRDSKAARQQAMLILSAMVGAVMMARAVNDKDLSLEILKVTGLALK